MVSLLLTLCTLAGPDQTPVHRPNHSCVILPSSNVRPASTWTNDLWPRGMVPFVFAPGVTYANSVAIHAAMDELESVAQIYFFDRTNEPNYIVIESGLFNSAQVGMQGGEQYMSIFNWDERFIMCHELMHALGVKHEQCRDDRNTYVTIHCENVTGGCDGATAQNFAIANDAMAWDAYDFGSVMHYSGDAFSSNGNLTIECRPPFAHMQNVIGQRERLSELDKVGLVRQYGPYCIADFDRDGEVNFFDYLDWTSAFAIQDLSADVNHDGFLDFFDYLDFVDSFLTGCPGA